MEDFARSAGSTATIWEVRICNHIRANHLSWAIILHNLLNGQSHEINRAIEKLPACQLLDSNMVSQSRGS